jgi:hypothetical protein
MAGQDKDSEEKVGLNSSPSRGSFQIDNLIKHVENGTKSAEAAEEMIGFYKSHAELRQEQEATEEWRENNMEYDLRSTPWICDKVKGDDVYAQNLYAAMCNNDFQRNDMMPILKDQKWSCSWRHAGGIIADMQEQGDYIDWYCSGIRNTAPIEQSAWDNLTLEEQQRYKEQEAYVAESVVTDEIRSDLKKLGWLVLNNKEMEI